jgi:hypothetical protein
MRNILDQIFDSLPFGIGVPILIGVGLTMLADEFKLFNAARVCFYLSVVWAYGKVLMWACFTSERFVIRAILAFLVCGAVGVCLIEALRLTTYRESTERPSPSPVPPYSAPNPPAQPLAPETTPVAPPPKPKKPESPVIETAYSVEIITAIMTSISRDTAIFFSKWEVTPDGIEKVTPVPIVFWVRLENRGSAPKRIVEWDLELIGSNASVVPTEIRFDAPMYLSSGRHVAFSEPGLRRTLEERPIPAHDFVTGILLLDVPKEFNTGAEQGPWKLRIGLRALDDSKKYYAVSSFLPKADNLIENLGVKNFPDSTDPSKWTVTHIADN